MLSLGGRILCALGRSAQTRRVLLENAPKVAAVKLIHSINHTAQGMGRGGVSLGIHRLAFIFV
jgi:hypothetical protein